MATCTFKLPDNITTYRITAQSANENMQLGIATKDIESKLAFFIQSVEPRGLKTTDDIVLNATGIVDDNVIVREEERINLGANSDNKTEQKNATKLSEIEYEFTIKETNKTLTAKGDRSDTVTVNFGKLPFGTYHVTIKGKCMEKTDAIEYEFNVVESTQEVYKKTTMNVLNSQSKIKPSKNPIVFEIYNKDMGKYVEYLDFISSTLTQRLDTQIAYCKAQEIRNKYYGTDNEISRIEFESYKSEKGILKNLKSGNENIVLTALASYYAKNIVPICSIYNLDKVNIYEYYLLEAAKKEPVLNEILYLKNKQDLDTYSKILLTLGLEFLGDYKDASELYKTIDISSDEIKKYKSLIAIIETFIEKESVTEKIDDIIKNSPADEYVRFAILSYFENNSVDLEKVSTIKINNGSVSETITINGMEVKTYTINDKDLSEINFETESTDLLASYYYQTNVEDVDDNMKKDMKISIAKAKELKNNSDITLKIEFDDKNLEGNLRIALPNSLRLNYRYNETDVKERGFYLQKNAINYINIYKVKGTKTINIPLRTICAGNYKIENVVGNIDGNYHISNSIEINIK